VSATARRGSPEQDSGASPTPVAAQPRPRIEVGPWWSLVAFGFHRADRWRLKARLIVGLSAAALFLTLCFAIGRAREEPLHDRLARIGEWHFAFSSLFTAMLGCFFVSHRTALAVCNDRSRELMLMVMTTPSSAFAYLLGEIVRAVRGGIELWLATLPLLVLSVVIGAGRLESLFFAAGWALAFTSLGAAAGALGGALGRQMALAQFLSLLFGIGPLLYAEYLGARLADAAVASVRGWGVRPEWFAIMLGSWALAATYLGLATFVLGRMWKRDRTCIAWIPSSPPAVNAGGEPIRAHRAPAARAPVTDRPLLWREFHCNGARNRRASWPVLLLLLLGICVAHAALGWNREPLFAWVTIWLGAAVGGGVFLVEYHKGMIDLLRLTSLVERDLFIAKICEFAAFEAYGLAMLAIVLTLGVLQGKYGVAAASVGWLGVLPAAALAVVIGVRSGMRSPTPSLQTTLASFVAIAWLGLPCLAIGSPESVWRTATVALSPAASLDALLKGRASPGHELAVGASSLLFLSLAAWIARGGMTEEPILPEPRRKS
jgi:hypothetical protein